MCFIWLGPTSTPAPCQAGDFKCASGDQCIPVALMCDYALNCEDGSDELDCSKLLGKDCNLLLMKLKLDNISGILLYIEA